MSNSVIAERAFDFAVSIVRLSDYLVTEKKDFVLSKQILRSGTSIGANCAEAKYAASKKDFINKFTIALKEANETNYWLKLLFAADKINKEKFDELAVECRHITNIISSIVKTSKENEENLPE